MFLNQKEIVIFDTEYTCWEGSMERKWSGPNEYREIVQIGGIVVDTETLTETDSFIIFIKPTLNPTLSDYFIKLTGITQATVETEGVDFKTALDRFLAWRKNRPSYSFGSDERHFTENCELLKLPYPELSDFYEVKDIFKKHGIPADEYQSGIILRAFGKEPIRRGHDALNDARSILDGLRELKDKLEKEGKL